MQYKVNEEGFNALSEDVQKLYKKDGDSYILGVEGMPEIPDVSGLKAKVDELLGEKKAAAKAAEEAEQARKAAEHEAATKKGDVDALNKSWEEKTAGLQATIDSLNGTISEITSGAEATRLASELAVQGASDVLLPHLKSRLKTEMVDGIPKTVVVDSSGKPSALTVAELKNEFQNNEAFASVIVGSKAGGGGTSNQSGSGGTGKTISRANFDNMGLLEQRTYIKEGGTVTDEAA